MLSVKAIYEAGRIQLLEPVNIKESTVILTFLDQDTSFVHDEDADAFYQKLRKHARFKAKGDIVILMDGEEALYPLFDYSGGGLSFLAEVPFDTGKDVTAILRYEAAGELLTMDFKITVRRSDQEQGRYKIGCQFYDSVDEDLWHTIVGG